MNPVERATDFVRDHLSEQLLVVTGAGISVASGIPTFRGNDPGALWKRDVTELGTLRYFTEDPVGSWRWYLSRFEKTMDARPNPAHAALARLEDLCAAARGQLLIVTQNIDGLHRQAGSRNLVEVHGRADRIRCPREGCAHGAPAGSLARAQFDLEGFRRDPSMASLPRCPSCRVPMRQHVLWFDEYYDSHDDYQWPRVLQWAATCDAVLFVGTSFSVGVTDMILGNAIHRGVPVMSVDPSPLPSPVVGVVPVAVPAEEILPQVVHRLTLAPG